MWITQSRPTGYTFAEGVEFARKSEMRLGNDQFVNPLTTKPNDAVRKQKKIFTGSFQLSFVTILNYHTSGNLKSNNFGIFNA